MSAFLIGSFIVVHLVNHFLAIGGIDSHIAFMESVRRLYRLPVAEVLLLSSIPLQKGVTGLSPAQMLD